MIKDCWAPPAALNWLIGPAMPVQRGTVLGGTTTIVIMVGTEGKAKRFWICCGVKPRTSATRMIQGPLGSLPV